jgi:septal ring factor EnvC (AmiA/AmiB activator)
MRGIILGCVGVGVLWLVGAAVLSAQASRAQDQIAAAQAHAEEEEAAARRCAAALRKAELAGADTAGRLAELHFWLDVTRAGTASTGVLR